jgi:probable addiction module antidote protein
MATRRFQTYLLEKLEDPRDAAAYLRVAVEDGDPDTLLMALQTLAKAKGGLALLAKKTGLHRVHLYRMLDKGGNPSFKNTLSILEALGLRISFETNTKHPARQAHQRHAAAAV